MATCAACEALLQGEARAEAQLEQALRAPSSANVVSLSRRRRVASAAFAAAAVALAASLWLVLGTPPSPPPPPLMALADAGAPDTADGLDVPRYEEDAVMPPEALSAFHPLDF